MPDTGNSATIAFGTSSFTAQFVMIGGTEQERPKLKISHLGTTVKEIYMPGDLYEPGDFEVQFYYDPNNQPPIGGAAETVTITYPVPSGSSNGATLAGTAFVTKWKTGDLKNNEVMMATATVSWSGVTGPTFTDAS